jgi:tetratricopeptide (TPR) repeat protein
LHTQPSDPLVRRVPRELPATAGPFIGRISELHELTCVLDTADLHAIVVISGMAGVGKTTLCVNWAHRVVDRFPDGQLYVNLRGFDPSHAPLSPADAVRGFLDAFGYPPDRLPLSLDAQASLYRSIMSDRRALIVLDNALNAGQVRPLLPGNSQSLVLVTSRDRLTGLVVGHAARSIELGLLNHRDACEVITSRLSQTSQDPQALDELATRCGGLPLALSIVGARAASRPTFPIATLVEELQTERRQLDLLTTGDPATTARTVLACSYHALDADSQRVFRLLGLQTGTEISLYAAASLTDLSVSRARHVLHDLSRVHLLDEPTPTRFGFHDLVREFASDCAHADEPEPDRRLAVHRLIDYYLHAALAGDDLLGPHRRRIIRKQPLPGVVTLKFSHYQEAMDWFRVEHAALVGAVDTAVELGLDDLAWQLPWALSTYMRRTGHLHDRAAVQRAASAAARRLGNREAEAITSRLLGNVINRLGSYDEAIDLHNHALTLLQEPDDVAERADTLLARGRVLSRMGRFDDARADAAAAYRFALAAESRDLQAGALTMGAHCTSVLGRPTEGAETCKQALVIYREIGNPEGIADALCTLALALQLAGEPAQAVEHYRESIRLDYELDDRYYTAYALNNVGDSYWDLGQSAAAVEAWEQALAIFDQLNQPDAYDVRAKLAVRARARQVPPDSA